MKAAEEAFAQVEEYENELEFGEGEGIDDRLTAEAALGFAKNLDLAMRVSGKESARAIN
jgi:hypothetical protein